MKRLAPLLLILAGGGGAEAPPPAPAPAPAVVTKVVFIGDSITANWWVGSYVAGAVNAGVSGNSTSQMLTRFDADVLSQHPDVVVILGGINDLPGWEEHPELDYANPANLTAMADKALAAGARVIVGTILPTSRADRPDSLIRLYNQRLKAAAPVHGYSVVDYYPAMETAEGGFRAELFLDGLHPSAAGYAVMWSVLRPVLSAG